MSKVHKLVNENQIQSNKRDRTLLIDKHTLYKQQ